MKYLQNFAATYLSFQFWIQIMYTTLLFFVDLNLYIFFFSRDNYGFVTFDSKKDAFSAIEHGNDDTSYPKVDLCFGGRRAFCKEKYADLGKYMSMSKERVLHLRIVWIVEFKKKNFYEARWPIAR